jgi:hypothetical protein
MRVINNPVMFSRRTDGLKETYKNKLWEHGMGGNTYEDMRDINLDQTRLREIRIYGIWPYIKLHIIPAKSLQSSILLSQGRDDIYFVCGSKR